MSVQVPDWTVELSPATAEKVAELIERAGVADGVAPISEQAVLSVSAATGGRPLAESGTPARPSASPAADADPASDTRAAAVESAGADADAVDPVGADLDAVESAAATRHLAVERDGELVAYANLVAAHGDHPAMAEAVVDPRVRGRGIGAALVAAALEAGGPGARVWAHGNLAPARAVAGRLGLTVARELWQMRRLLASADQATVELPELRVPDDLVLRTYAGPSEDAEILRVNNAAFDWHPEQGGWTEDEIAVRRAAPWFDPKGLFIAADPADPQRVLGFHWTKVHEADETSDAVGEVYVVAIDPSAQGRGLGRVLTLAGLHYLRDRGLGAVILYTEADNTAAVHTYTRLGFETAHIDAAYAAR